MPLPSGTRLGRIRIDTLIGEGGMGFVYRGFDERLERAVAVKEIHADKRRAAAGRARFLREARALSQLDHPNICRIYDVLERPDGDYLILELIEGETLRQRLERGVSRDEALRIAMQVARVLAVAHERGIVHRDLKPDNVMITASGAVKVLDFGLARFAADAPVGAEAIDAPIPSETVELPTGYVETTDVERTAVMAEDGETTDRDASRTVAGSLVGTVTYMSPEQARGQRVDAASDVYALGVFLFELVSGRRPYGEPESFHELLRRVRAAEIEWRDLGSVELSSLVRRLTAPDPANRPTAEEAARSLEALLERPARIRRRWMYAGLAAALLFVIAGSVFVAQRLLDRRAVLRAQRAGRIAFLPFRNETGDRRLQWVEIGLMELVSGSVAAVRGVAVVAPDETLRAMRDLGLARGGTLSDSQRTRLLDALGASAVIESVVRADERDTYAIRFAAAARERVERARQVSSSVLTEAANQMVRDVAVRLDPNARPAELRTRYSADAFANTAYAIGEQELRVRGAKAAEPYFAVAVDRDPEFAAAKLELADVRNSMGEYAEAVRLATEVAEQARRRGDKWTRALALTELADFRTERSELAEAERLAAEALQIATRLHDEDLAMAARNSLGHIAWRTNRLDRADAMFRAAHAAAVATNNVSKQAAFVNNRGLVAEARRRYPEAERFYRQALQLADRASERDIAAAAMGNLSDIALNQGRAAEAETLLRRQLEYSVQRADLLMEIKALVNLAILTYSRGAEEEAIALTSRAADVARRIGEPRIESLALANVATARTKRGELALAGADAQQALALLPRIAGDAQTTGDVKLGYVYWLIRMRRVDEALRLIDEVERTWEVNGRTLRMRARAAYERGDYRSAATLIRRSKAIVDQWLTQDEQMYQAMLESERTGRAAAVPFEGPVR